MMGMMLTGRSTEAPLCRGESAAETVTCAGLHVCSASAQATGLRRSKVSLLLSFIVFTAGLLSSICDAPQCRQPWERPASVDL